MACAKLNLRAAVALVFALAATLPAAAQSTITRSGGAELLDRYTAFIGDDDLTNSSGVRLTRPWQIIRQDRANFHSFGVRQRGDEGDTFFASPANRQILEAMLARGTIERSAARLITRGNVLIEVSVYGRRGRGDWVDVRVLD